MKLIIGLGNPGEKYELTRHNVGWLALNHFLRRKDVTIEEAHAKKFDSLLTTATVGGEKHLFLYPITFMNESGRAVQKAMQFYKLAPSEIIVLHDEIDLPLGTIRLTQDSGAAGHNGVKSIIEHLGTSAFRRIRIGIESRTEGRIPPTDAFVLQPFTPTELDLLPFDEIDTRLEQEMKK